MINFAKKKMKHIYFILLLLVSMVSCSEEEPWTIEKDILEFEKSNPYRAIFINETAGDLFITCDGLYSTNLHTLHQGDESEVFHGPSPDITVKYSGEGTHFTLMEKKIV